MNMCDYGCGNISKFNLKCGKNCCSDHFNKCPAIRLKNSQKRKLQCENGIANNNFKLARQAGNLKTWNKGLTKDTDSRIKKSAIKYKEGISNGRIIPSWLGRKHTQESKRKIALHGGIREGSGRSKQGTYQGYRCQSSWELAYVIYNIDHAIKFSRNKQGFEYQFKGKNYKYYPDFILEDGTYIEIKGYMTPQNKAKIDSFKLPLIVIDKKEIDLYLKYAIEKYGKNFISVYNK